MAVRSRQIGWSNKSNLLYGILKEFDAINCQICNTTSTSTTATPTPLVPFDGVIGSLGQGCVGRTLPITIYLSPACAAVEGITIGCQIWLDAEGTIAAPEGDYGNFPSIGIGFYYIASVNGSGVVTNVIICP